MCELTVTNLLSPVLWSPIDEMEKSVWTETHVHSGTHGGELCTTGPQDNALTCRRLHFIASIRNPMSTVEANIRELEIGMERQRC